MKTSEITLRDYYAGLAMQEYLKHYLERDIPIHESTTLSQESFETADAMLAERNREATS